MTIKNVSSKDFDALVLGTKKPIVVDFYADWCAPCKAMTPVLEDLADDYADRVDLIKVDVDNAQELAGRLKISSIPTLLLFRPGEESTLLAVGVVTKEELSKKLEELLLVAK